jgi:ATP-dependent RNA helicase RhlE
MSFESIQLSKPLKRAIADQGFTQPTAVQEQAIPAILAGRDVLGTAQTGTGKTVAFLLPSFERLLEGKSKGNPRLLVVAPTRELAVQIADEARKLKRHTHLRVVAVYGGTSMKKQIQQLKKGVDVLVATPGRLLDHIRRKHIRLNRIELLVLDEADRMLDMGFLPDIKEIVSKVPRERQTMLFSATMPRAIEAMSRRFLKNPVRVEINTARPPQTIEQVLFPVQKHLKLPLLLELIEREAVETALLFTRTKQEADVVTRQLREAELSVDEIHGDFSQKRRMRALDRFRRGKVRILVATNVAARGLDIEGITHVINYDVPDEAENYVHRIGRTARIGSAGVAWTLVTPEDEPLINSIEYLLEKALERRMVPGFNYDVPVPDWAKPSAKTILQRIDRNQDTIDRWKSLTR